MGERRKAQLADIAALTGAQVISEEIGLVKGNDFGYAGSCENSSC